MSTHRRILLVEDEPLAQRLFSEAVREIQETTVELDVASTGMEAFDYLPKRAAQEPQRLPDLIVLDLHLPDTSGLSILEELKESPTSLQYVPVIVMSGSEEQADIDAAYELGANAYLTKPDDYTDLVALTDALDTFWFRRARRHST